MEEKKQEKPLIEMSTTINGQALVSTSCRDCVLAKYNDKTQTGCLLDRLNKFKKHGVEIIEAYDEEKEFYVINGRICNTCTPKEKIPSIYLKESILKDYIRGKVSFKADTLVLVSKQHTEDDIVKTLQSLKEQQLPVYKITLVLNKEGLMPSKLKTLMLEHVPSVKWRIAWITERNEDGSMVNDAKALDLAVKQCKTVYYTVFHAGFKVPKTFFASIDKAINDELERFILLVPRYSNIGNGLTVATIQHKHLHGNRDKPLVYKIAELAKEQNTPFFVKKVEDICQEM